MDCKAKLWFCPCKGNYLESGVFLSLTNRTNGMCPFLQMCKVMGIYWEFLALIPEILSKLYFYFLNCKYC